jgi:hypothetical protein
MERRRQQRGLSHRVLAKQAGWRIGPKPTPSTSLSSTCGGSADDRSHRVWRWVFAMALLTLAGCEGEQSPVAPTSDVPAGCIDEFSGLPHRGCS